MKLASAIPAFVASAFLIAGASFAGDDAAKKEAVPGYERTGETRSCINMRAIDSIDAVSNTVFLVRVGNQFYANDLRGKCMGADSPFTYLSYSTSGPDLCRGEIIHVVDQSGGFIRGGCGLGEFELLKPVAATE